MQGFGEILRLLSNIMGSVVYFFINVNVTNISVYK